ncbi:MAG: hypothetical protein Q4D52_03315 [Eubacteriales bacterium]|nr:hypothetical protein [Eubacteriales bacterium]
MLKNYFKQQGLSQDEGAQAIAAFKLQKQASTPDITALQASLAEAQKAAAEATTAGKLQMEAIKLGVDARTLPYVLRLANTSALTGEAKDETCTAVISKV